MAPASAPAWTPAGTAGRDRDKRFAIAMAIGAGLVALGAFLPWFSLTAPFIGTVSRSGIEQGDGWFFLGAAVVVGLLAYRASTRGWTSPNTRFFSIATAVALTGMTIYEWQDMERVFRNARDSATSGTFQIHVLVGFSTGFYLTIAGTAVVLVSAIFNYRRSPSMAVG